MPRLVPAAMLEVEADGVVRSIFAIDDIEFLPLAGISERTTVLCNETGRYAIYQSDEHGFRNPDDLWTQAPVELVLIGDSFTMGDCVAPGETIADRLRAKWAKTVNLGYSGHSPLLELATLIEYAPRLRPQRTLWFYFENDLSWFDLGRSERSPLLIRYLEPGFSQSLVDRQAEIDGKLMELVATGRNQPDDAGPIQEEIASRSSTARRLIDFLKLIRTRAALAEGLGVVRARAHAPNAALFETILRRARDQAATWQGELVVVFIPGVWNFGAKEDAPSWVPGNNRELVASTARSLDLRFIDLQQALEKHPDPASLYSFRGESRLASPHMNSKGYAITSEIVRDVLER